MSNQNQGQKGHQPKASTHKAPGQKPADQMKQDAGQKPAQQGTDVNKSPKRDDAGHGGTNRGGGH